MPNERVANMESKQQVRHLFQGPPRYRAFLLVAALLMTALLVIGGTLLRADMNWARQLCPLVGALSAALFATLVAVDIYRPQAITPARMKVVVRVFLALPIIAIMLAVAGFLA